MKGRIYLCKDSLVPPRDACTYRKILLRSILFFKKITIQFIKVTVVKRKLSLS